jgi:hypothetical protein
MTKFVIYENRWKNAVRRATKLNYYMLKGYLVVGSDGKKLDCGFEIKEDKIFFLKHDSTEIIYFERRPKGNIPTSKLVKEYKEKFMKWHVYHPRNGKICLR